jgi:predicted DCC family thiol-disulfide oxidoreductase YuxK
MPHPILLYDGVCGLCNRFVQFILRRDRGEIFHFASLQSTLAARILTRHAADPLDLDTVYVVLDYELPNESLLSRSEAVVFILKHLSRPWPLVAPVLQGLPKIVRDRAYNAIACHRYRLFGRADTCTLPRDQDHSRFLDL